MIGFRWAAPCDGERCTIKYGRLAIFFVILILHLAAIVLVFMNPDIKLCDYIATWLFGCLLASIELSSKYKDDPASVLSSSPGLLYIGINGLICVLGLYLMYMFGIGTKVDSSLPHLAQRTMNILQASLSSFFIMRSSFLKLGNNSEIDLGLNAVLKKLFDIVDREVDRVRAVKRSKDITDLFKNVSHANTKHVFSLCLNVMQNVSVDEAAVIQRKIDELESVIGSDSLTLMDLDMKQIDIGLELYNIVGISVLKAVVKDLKLDKCEDNGNGKSNTAKKDMSPESPDVITKNLQVKIKDVPPLGPDGTSDD